MAAVPTPRTWAVGELLTAAKLNADLRDGLSFLLAPPLAILRTTSATSVPSNTPTAIGFQAEDIDRDGGHSTVTNPSRYTAQTAGYYRLTASADWSDGYDTGERQALFRKSDGSVHGMVMGPPVPPPALNNGACTLSTSALLYLGVGDYVELRCWHWEQAITLFVNGSMTVQWASS